VPLSAAIEELVVLQPNDEFMLIIIINPASGNAIIIELQGYRIVYTHQKYNSLT